MKVVRRPGGLGLGPRAVALGTFDGVHLGHRRVIETLLDAGPEPTVVTFDPHPRTALGNRVDLLMSLERRLELLAGLGVDAALVVEFTLDVARLEPQAFADEFLRPIGAETVVAGVDFRFGRARQGDLTVLESLGFTTRPVPLLEKPAACRCPPPAPEARAISDTSSSSADARRLIRLAGPSPRGGSRINAAMSAPSTARR